ncbi:MAG: hypothetical protein ACOYMD_07095, partial [Paludibacter sp.]
MIHNFSKSLHHEREQAIKADDFYRDVLKVSEIKRFNSDSEADMKMQLQDVDLLITLNGITYKVSEKFRDKDYGDLYVEVYSKYPKTPGWLHTGSPNAILYFTPNTVYWITHKSLKEFCIDKLFPLIPDTWWKEQFQSHKSIVSKSIVLNNKVFKINLIQAHNSDGANWETFGISAPFSVFEEYGV